MGTRHLIMVIDKNNALKVAQYGQWDGYPSGQGVDVLAFAKDKDKMNLLQERFDIIKFYNEDESFKEYEEAYNSRAPQWSNEPDKRTTEDKYWWETTQTRDLGADILKSLIELDINLLPKEHNGNIYLDNDSKFLKDSLYCEWAYCINFHTNKLMVFQGFNKDKSKEHEFCKTTEEEIKESYKDVDYKYYGCALKKEYDLDNLPTKEEFLKDLESNEDGDEE